eukprot:Plantae.Rhodophyta-Purpureofilum_apyrenoidigerum.ctg5331.p1 GENE.Plantae.Rhodophyta-Purpureofilum_apyrenoidigerum.ctg5331~~Plantae.Rhodophyta-Purpureofilum_apyrenoidigerum.ctg5331.p1  ORF type:complete len:220 (+),score=74.80 Plantae.Rhodophyta-Purpureofilum_apyrenoidigerum.ctg5331:330-989(+)
METEDAQRFGAALGKLLRSSKKRKAKPNENDDGVELKGGRETRKRAEERKKLKQAEEKASLRRAERMQKVEQARVVPDAATDIEKERRLKKLATKGAVALFNAVAKYQKVHAETPNSTRTEKIKEAKTVGGDQFLEMLQRGKEQPSDADVEENGSTWKAVDDTFIAVPSKLKDWDKGEQDSDEEMLAETIDVNDIGDDDSTESGGSDAENGNNSYDDSE